MRIYDGRFSFYQWDLDQKLISQDLEVDEEVYFSNTLMKKPKVVKAYALSTGEIVVNVPNLLLQYDIPITIYKYVNVAGVRTCRGCVLQVLPRPRPVDYIYTDTDEVDYSVLEQRVDSLEDNTESIDGRVDTLESRVETLDDSDAIFAGKISALDEYTDSLGGRVNTLESFVGEVMQIVYPVGSIYMSTNSTSPATLFGGTWEAITGRFLMASGTPTINTTSKYGSMNGAGYSFEVGEKGGQFNHTLTINEMPSHTHGVVRPKYFFAEDTNDQSIIGETSTTTRVVPGVTTGATGGGQMHNVLNPYYAVNIWKRIA